MNLQPPFEHNGVRYAILTKEEAVMDPAFPREHRLKISKAPSAKFVIMKAIEECDLDRKYLCEIEN